MWGCLIVGLKFSQKCTWGFVHLSPPTVCSTSKDAGSLFPLHTLIPDLPVQWHVTYPTLIYVKELPQLRKPSVVPCSVNVKMFLFLWYSRPFTAHALQIFHSASPVTPHQVSIGLNMVKYCSMTPLPMNIQFAWLF